MLEGGPDPRARREVDDGVRALLEGPAHGRGVADVALDHLRSRRRRDIGPLDPGGVEIVEVVEDDNAHARSDQSLDEGRADEAGTAGDEHSHEGAIRCPLSAYFRGAYRANAIRRRGESGKRSVNGGGRGVRARWSGAEAGAREE